MRRQRSGGAPCSRGGPAERRSAPTREQLCCCSPPAVLGAQSATKARGSPRAAWPCRDTGAAFCRRFAGPSAPRGSEMPSPDSSPGFCSLLTAGPGLFLAVTFRRCFCAFGGICASQPALCPTARSVSHSHAASTASLHLQSRDEALRPQGGSGFELHIKRNFQPSDVGTECSCTGLGRPSQAGPVAPCPPPPPSTAPFPVLSSHPNLLTPAQPSQAQADISARSERGFGRPRRRDMNN